MFRVPTTQGLDVKKYESRWFKGLYLGRDATSDEILVGASTGVFKVRTLRRCSIPERFDKEIFEKFVPTPWDHRNEGQFYPKFLIPSNLFLQGPSEESQKENPSSGSRGEGDQGIT